MSLHWRKLSSKRINVNRWRSFSKKRFRLPSGVVGDFYTSNGHPFVCALVLTPDRKIVLAQQFRPGPEKIMFELPGGAIEPNEPPRHAVQREVLEETGYRGSVRAIGVSTNDGWNDHFRHHFLITNAHQVQSHTPDHFESIRVVTRTIPQVIRLAQQGKLTDFETLYRGLEALRVIRYVG